MKIFFKAFGRYAVNVYEGKTSVPLLSAESQVFEPASGLEFSQAPFVDDRSPKKMQLDEALVDLIESAFPGGQIDGRAADLAHLFMLEDAQCCARDID